MLSFKFISVLIVGILIASCRSIQSVPESTTIEKTVYVKDVIHDTLVVTKSDSSSAKFKLQVDSLGKISIRSLEDYTAGRSLLIPKAKIINNTLTIDCQKQAEELFIQWKTQLRDSVYKTVVNKPQKIIYKSVNLSFWQSLQIWLGRAFILVFILALWFLYRKYWPKNTKQ